MKIKTVIPYLLAMSAFSIPASPRAQADVTRDDGNTGRTRLEIPAELKNKVAMNTNTANLFIPAMDMKYDMQIMDNKYLDDKADELVDAYMSNMLDAQQRLGPMLGTRGYRAAVLRELPGAPVGHHCVFGQYTQLARALQEMGDTLTIVPHDASRACTSFKALMKKKYSGPEFAGAIHQGNMYETDAEYNAALDRYLAAHKITPKTNASVRAKAEQEFARSNFSADELSPGSMMLVRNGGHLIMYLGRGRVVNGHFVADKNGRHMYVGHNRERMGDLIETWGTRNIFASDTRKIARVLYSQEWRKIETLSDSDLLKYVAPRPETRGQLMTASRAELLRLARERYFHQAMPTQPQNQGRGALAMNEVPQDNTMTILQMSQRTI